MWGRCRDIGRIAASVLIAVFVGGFGISRAQAAVDYDVFAVGFAGGGASKLYRIDDSLSGTLTEVPLPAGVSPQRVYSDGNGSVYLTSIGLNKVWKINPLTGELLQSFDWPGAMALATNGQHLFIGQATTPFRYVHRALLDGTPANVGAFPLSTGSDYAFDIQFSDADEVMISARYLRKYDAVTGASMPFVLTKSGMPAEPTAGYFAQRGDDLFIRNFDKIDRYDAAGNYQSLFATGGTSVGGSVGGGAILFGPNGHLYAAEAAEGIRMLNGTTGALITRLSITSSSFAFVPVPEPSASLLFGTAGLLLTCARRR